MGNCLGSQPGRTDPLSQRLRAIARCSGPVSLDNLPRINQRREVHLQFDYILILNDGANDSILDFAVVQVHADFVAYVEFAFWLLGWHAKNVRLTETIRNDPVICSFARGNSGLWIGDGCAARPLTPEYHERETVRSDAPSHCVTSILPNP